MNPLDKVKSTLANQKDIGKVNEFYNRLNVSKEDKKTYHHNWNNYIRMYKGIQWDANRPNWRVSSVNNISFSLIESMIPLMTDNEPTILTQPQSSDDTDISMKMNLLLKHLWYSQSMNSKYVRVIRDVLMFGTGFLKVGWDPEKLNGMGEVMCDVIDPFDLFVDPNATSMESAEYIIYRTKLSLRVIRKKYPKGKEVKSDFEYFNDESSRETPSKHNRKESTIATVYEEWSRTDEGMLVRTFSSGILLEEKLNPFEHDEYPFIPFHNYHLNNEFWGYSELANLESLQKENNKIRSLIVENLQTTANNIWLVDTTSGVEKGHITSRPGQVIYKNPGGDVRRLEGSNLPNSLFSQLNDIQSSMENTAGIHPISYGVSPGSVTAASSLAILTENAQTRIRGKLRSMEVGLMELGKWYIALVRQFYTEPRIIRLTEDNGFKFESFDGTQLRKEEFDPNTGELINTYLTELDVNVVPGSSMRVNKSARYQQAIEMYNAGALDPETLVELSEIGDKQKIIDRLIKHGRLTDPNDPQAKIDRVIKAITDKIKFNVSSTDPMIVDSALKELLANEEMAREQLGVANPATPEGGEMQANGQGQPPEMGGMSGQGQPPQGGLPPEMGGMPPGMEQPPMGGQGLPPEMAGMPPEPGMAPPMGEQGLPPEQGLMESGNELSPEVLQMMEQLAQQGVPKEEAIQIIEQQLAGELQAGINPLEAENTQMAPQGGQEVPPEILMLIEQLVAQGMSEEEAMAMIQQYLAQNTGQAPGEEEPLTEEEAQAIEEQARQDAMNQ